MVRGLWIRVFIVLSPAEGNVDVLGGYSFVGRFPSEERWNSNPKGSYVEAIDLRSRCI